MNVKAFLDAKPRRYRKYALDKIVKVSVGRHFLNNCLD